MTTGKGMRGPPPASKLMDLEDGFHRAMEVCFTAPWSIATLSSLLEQLRAQGSTVWYDLQAVFVVGVEAETDASVLGSYAVDVLRRMVAGWLSLGPDVRLCHLQESTSYSSSSKRGSDAMWWMGDWLVEPSLMGQRCLPQAWKCFLQDMHDSKPRDNGNGEISNDLYEDGLYDMDMVSWRRSALEFLPGLMASAPDFSEDAWVLEELAADLGEFDEVVDGLPAPPDGVPKTHVWWWPEGYTPRDIVAQLAQFHEGSREDDSDDGC